MLILKMKDGKEYKVTDMNGKYYVCGNTQFRTMNPNITDVIVADDPVEIAEEKVEEAVEEKVEEKAPEKRTTKKSRKSAAKESEEEKGE